MCRYVLAPSQKSDEAKPYLNCENNQASVSKNKTIAGKILRGNSLKSQ